MEFGRVTKTILKFGYNRDNRFYYVKHIVIMAQVKKIGSIGTMDVRALSA